MIDLPVVPLERLPDDPARPGPAVFLKREDLLPWGGGNKVRRLLCWFDEQSAGRGLDSAANPAARRVIGALSDRGAHTFLALSRMLREGAVPAESLVLWERKQPATPYADRIRREYLSDPRVTVRSSGTAFALARWLYARWFRRRSMIVLGIGGAVRTRANPFEAVFDECQRQLDECAPVVAGSMDARVWHLLPMASGQMADGFLRVIRSRGWPMHRVLGVLTGPWVSRRWLRWKYARTSGIALIDPPPISWCDYRTIARRFHDRSGVWIDPRHTVHTAALLDHLPQYIAAEDTIVFWITCPRTTDVSSP